MSDKNSRVEEIFERNFDRKMRRIYFGVLNDEGHEEFSWNTVEKAVRAIHLLVSDNPKKPIELHIQSCGGSATSMLRLVDVILSCPCQVKFFGGGQIASAATWLMAICDERNLYPNTEIMLHDGLDEIEGKHTDVQIEAKSTKDLQSKLDKLFAENSHMPESFWNDILQRDVYITASEAVSLGIADNIIQPKKRGNLRRSRIAKMSNAPDEKELKKLIKDLYKRTNRKGIVKIDVTVPKKEEFDPDIIIDESGEDIIPENQ